MKVAITGGIAEGKSTVLHYLQELGFETLSADVVAKEVLRDPKVWAEIVETLDIAKDIESKRLLQLISEDPKKREMLDQITHPLILKKIVNSTAQFIEIPLLFETSTQGHFDQVWVVACSEEEQKRRIINRWGGISYIEPLLTMQLPSSVKRSLADYIIHTDQPEELVKRDVLAILKENGFFPPMTRQ
jgi:dephospho-CoA kinase